MGAPRAGSLNVWDEWGEGQPFAYVPTEALAWPVRDNALSLYVAACTLADVHGEFFAPEGGWAAALGCSVRTARRSIAELLAHTLIFDPAAPMYEADVSRFDLQAQGGRRKEYLLQIPRQDPDTGIFDAEGLAMRPFARVPVRMWADPEFSPAMRRVWVALWSFADTSKRGTARVWPLIETLSERANQNPRSVQRALAKLVAAGYVERARRRDTSDLFTLQSTPPNGVKTVTPNGVKTVTPMVSEVSPHGVKTVTQKKKQTKRQDQETRDTPISGGNRPIRSRPVDHSESEPAGAPDPAPPAKPTPPAGDAGNPTPDPTAPRVMPWVALGFVDSPVGRSHWHAWLDWHRTHGNGFETETESAAHYRRDQGYASHGDPDAREPAAMRSA